MLNITNEAAEWFKQELDLQEGQAIRFFPRYSSGGGVHPGFSLGIEVNVPTVPGLLTEAGGIKFYMEERDLWYLEGYHFNVTYNANAGDIEYEYEAADSK